MGGIYGFGQRAAQIPGQVGALAKRAFALPGQAQDAFMGAGNAIGAGLREGALEFGAGAFGGPTYEDMDKEVYRSQHPIQSVYEEGMSLNGMFDEPPPEPVGGLSLIDRQPNDYGPDPAQGALSKTMDPQAPPVGALAGGMPNFGDVGGGASGDQASGAIPTLFRPNEEPENHIRFSMDGGPMEDYAPGQSMPGGALRGSAFGQEYQPASGGGTVSMMSGSPEAEAYVTRASRLEDAQAESEIRAARGEPSPGDIYRYQQQQAQKFGPDQQLKFAQAEATNGELGRLNELSQKLADAVRSGQIAQEQADSIFQKERESAAFRVQAVNGGNLSQWGPEKAAFSFPPG